MNNQVVMKLLGGKYERETVSFDGGLVQLGASKEPGQVIYKVLDPSTSYASSVPMDLSMNVK